METSCVDPNTAAEFLEGLLSVELCARVEGHMAQCGECRRLIAALAQETSGEGDTEPDVDDSALASTDLGGRRPLRAGSEADPIREGTKVDRFTVLERVGAGGMGVVYAAYDPHLDRKIALKFLRGETDQGSHHSADARARLIGEAQAIARITHPNVISVYDVGTYRDEVYIAMEFIAGQTLTRWLRRGRRDWREIRDVFVAAARGLVAAHQGELVHRDFKPENVIVGDDGRVCVMDFGLARSAAEEQEPTEPSEDGRTSALGASLTRTGTILGTPRYMAPEQFAGRTADARSDQFSLCVALYEALYKTYPFYGETAAQLAPQLAIADQLRPVERDREVPAWLRQAVLRGMSYDPDDRFSSMEDLIDSIADRVSRAARWTFAAAIVPVVVLGAFAFRSMSSEEEARDQARATEQRLDEVTREAEVAQKELAQLQREISELRVKVDSSDTLRKEVAVLKTELLTREARLQDIMEARQRRAEARKTLRVYNEGLDDGLVERYLMRRRGALETCYQRGRDLNPLMGQWVTTKFHISADGEVTWVSTKGLRSREVSDCVKSVMARIVFPKSHVATVATYAFDFEPGRSRTRLRLREGKTGEGAEPPRVLADGTSCEGDPDPLCGVE